MKGVLMVLTVLLCCYASVLHADVGPTGTHDMTEVLLITANGAASMINIAGMASGNPLDWAIVVGAAAGLTTIAYTLTTEHLEHENGMPLSGLAAIGTSLLSLGFHRENKQARLEPNWRGGSPGLSLVVDF